MVDKAGKKEYGGMFEAVIESMQEARAEGLEEGLIKGRKEAQEEAFREKLRTAANFKKLGVSIEVIAQATGLSLEEIETV